MTSTTILPSCVSSLQTSLSLLQSSINILNNSTADLPRLGKVLQTTRHFDLISESQLHAAQEQVRAEIQPEIERLLDMVETCLDRLGRREKGLIARKELLDGRLGEVEVAAGDARMRRRRTTTTTTTTTTTGRRLTMTATGKLNEKGERLRLLRQKKERLAYVVERLSLQAQQRERQLRKSMAAR
ncbi:MAG: hypothetical protein M1816_004041 [Peltula sp. TS41687]|nr:MAG: hypothetical protein M1816_004041 [Peltula sp. TS41687]